VGDVNSWPWTIKVKHITMLEENGEEDFTTIFVHKNGYQRKLQLKTSYSVFYAHFTTPLLLKSQNTVLTTKPKHLMYELAHTVCQQPFTTSDVF
jgi:hypothetical protein